MSKETIAALIGFVVGFVTAIACTLLPVICDFFDRHMGR